MKYGYFSENASVSIRALGCRRSVECGSEIRKGMVLFKAALPNEFRKSQQKECIVYSFIFAVYRCRKAYDYAAVNVFEPHIHVSTCGYLIPIRFESTRKVHPRRVADKQEICQAPHKYNEQTSAWMLKSGSPPNRSGSLVSSITSRSR